MKALVLAAGLGTRLGALTRHTPKPMLPVGGRPLLEHILSLLRRHGITDVAINLHHKPDAILRHFGSGEAWGVRLRYSYEAVLLGTAGAALRHLAWLYPDPFLVYYGDVYSDVNLTDLIEQHRAGGAVATLVVHQTDDPTRRGAVEFDASRRVRRFVEKPPSGDPSTPLPTPSGRGLRRADLRPPGAGTFSNWTNAGIYVLNPDVLRYASEIPSDFGQLFPRLLEAGCLVQAYPIDGTLIDIGSPEDYQAVQQLFAATGVASHATGVASHELPEWEASPDADTQLARAERGALAPATT